MKKEHLKMVFLLSFISIGCKSLYMGFDVAGCLALAITGVLLFAYDFISSKEAIDDINKQLELLVVQNKKASEDIQALRGIANAQKMSTPVKPNNNPFGVRI